MRDRKPVYGVPAFWVKASEVAMAKSRQLTVIIRQGDRSDRVAAKTWLSLLEPIPVHYIAVPGDQAKGVAAQFEPDEGATVQIVRRTVTRLGDVKEADLSFAEGSAVPTTADEVKSYLEGELVPGHTFEPSDMVTIYWVEHLPNEVVPT